MQIFKTLATDTMLWLAAAAAIITSFLSTPQVADINFHTLYSLLSMMILVQILEDIGLLQYFSSKFTAKARDTRQLMWMLVILAFGGAMLTPCLSWYRFFFALVINRTLTKFGG